MQMLPRFKPPANVSICFLNYGMIEFLEFLKCKKQQVEVKGHLINSLLLPVCAYLGGGMGGSADNKDALQHFVKHHHYKNSHFTAKQSDDNLRYLYVDSCLVCCSLEGRWLGISSRNYSVVRN